MIQYMPFSYVRESQLRYLSTLLGPFRVCQPAAALVPATMQAWAEKGLLVFAFPRGVDGLQVQRAMANHGQWARMHAGHLLDRAGAALAADGRPPLVDETDVSQILAHLRHEGQATPAESDNALLRAGLLLAICQEYDQQQEAAEQSLTSVEVLEQTMFAQLRGETDSAGDNPPLMSSTDTALPVSLMGRILWAWSLVARCAASAPRAFITCASQVVAELRERIGGDVQLGCWPFEAGSAAGGWAAILEGLAIAADPVLAVKQLLPDKSQPAEGPGLTLISIPGCPPSELLRQLSGGADTVCHASEWEEPPHTVLGLVGGQDGGLGRF